MKCIEFYVFILLVTVTLVREKKVNFFPHIECESKLSVLFYLQNPLWTEGDKRNVEQ